MADTGMADMGMADTGMTDMGMVDMGMVEILTEDDIMGEIDAPKRTLPFLSKYERARIIGLRGQQIADGAPPLVEIGDLKDAVKIAEKELEELKLPFIIKRPLPSGKFEYWRLDEFTF